MPLAGPLFKFALFQTRLDEFYFLACCHHIVIDGSGIALVGHRIATIYSAIVSGERIPPAFFGSLQDLVDCESDYEASNDYLEDQAYWSRNLPRKAGRIIGCPKPRASVIRTRLPRRFNWTRRSSAESKSYPKCCASVDHRSSPRRAHCWCVGGALTGSEVVLDFPVSRRVRPESKTLPGMLAGVVPLVLKASPESTVADFCQHVDTRIREALQHQRFPVHALERESGLRGPTQAANRVAVNFLPSRLTLDLRWRSGNGDIYQSWPRGSLWAVLLKEPVTSFFSARRALGSRFPILTSPI